MPSLDEVTDTIDSCLSTWKGAGRKEVAFYGGSFTALGRDTQVKYLRAAYRYVKAGLIEGVRISTRPDAISEDTLSALKAYKVDTVELGAQSMSDEILRLCARGHTSLDTIRAVSLLKKNGFKVGLQFMPGLPGDTAASAVETAERIIGLKPDFARVYPTVVLKGTPLHKMYLEGKYLPWSLEEMVRVCRIISRLFKESGIPIIRMGLQDTPELAGSIISGPYHPSFRSLVEQP